MHPVSRLWHNSRHGLDFALRNRLRWSPRARERAEDKADLWDGLEAPAAAGARDLEARWTRDFGLGPARERMTAGRWVRNLAVLEVLVRAAASPRFTLPDPGPEPLKVLDIGSKNFEYVDALHGFVRSVAGPRPPELTGIELDAHRRYTDFRTRRAWAEHYCSFCPGTRYLAGDLEQHDGAYGLITWFFPFVTEFPLVRWGLPTTKFRPQELFDHACGLLVPGGRMVLVNQNAQEFGLQRGLIERRGLSYEVLGLVPGSFSAVLRDWRAILVLRD